MGRDKVYACVYVMTLATHSNPIAITPNKTKELIPLLIVILLSVYFEMLNVECLSEAEC